MNQIVLPKYEQQIASAVPKVSAMSESGKKEAEQKVRAFTKISEIISVRSLS